MPEPKRRLTRLKFDRVDMVDQGANFDVDTGDGAHILLAKALHADDDKKKKPKGKLPAFLRGKRTDDAGALCELLPAVITVVETTVDALTKATPIAKDSEHALTFEDALFARKMGEVQHELALRFGALMESVDSVMFSDEPKKKQAVAARVGQFVASVKAAIPDLLKDLEKGGAAEQILAELLTLEDVDTGETPMAFKKSDLTGEALKAYEALETSVATLTKAVEDLKKAAAPDPGAGSGEPTEEQTLAKVADPAVRELLRKSFAETRKAREETRNAQQTADVEKRARLIRGEVDLLKGFKHLTFNPTEDAPHVLVLKAVGDGKPWERMLVVLKAADALLATRPIFEEIGKGGAGDGTSDSAVGLANAKAAEFIAKDDKLDVGNALKKVFAADPALYEAYKSETELRVGSTEADDEGGE